MPDESNPPPWFPSQSPLSWAEVIAAVRALPEQITLEDIGTVAVLAAILGVFSPFPRTSGEEKDDIREDT